MSILGEKNPTHLISTPGSNRQKLRHVDVQTRAGARHHRNLSRHERQPTSEERDREDAESLKSEAAMCYLRGLCFAKQNAFDRAKECYKTACQIDVQCFEAFDALMANSLMSPTEEWKFIDSLNFDDITVAGNASLSQEAAQFTKTLYTTRLSKYSRPEEFEDAVEQLTTHYKLADNPDIILAKADLMFTHCRFSKALQLTSSVLATDKYNFAVLPVHLACLHELGQKNALFLLSHDLTDTHPLEPCTWLAVGVYYLSINRIAEARRYFSKASVMDPHFGPAWIGFAHTFAAEGEHDQAISAYSTAARLFQGTHLPQLFLGMQNLLLNNFSLAQEYLNTAYGLCDSDPLLLNELGVVYYHEDRLGESISMFRHALQISAHNEADADAWLPTRTNLGHALRRYGAFDEALQAYEQVLRHGVKDAGLLTSKALVLMEMGRLWDAVTALHEALAVGPQDPMATDLLARALEINMGNEEEEAKAAEERRAVRDAEKESALLGGGGGGGGSDDDEEAGEIDRRIGSLKEIHLNRVAGRGRRRGGRRAMEDVSMLEESMMVDSDE